MSIFGDIAGAAGTAANLLGIGAKAHDKRQEEQQQKLTNQQVKANKELANHSQALQFDMWNKTNYEAQKAHLEAAGLNPGLMYGMSGGGGATTGGASAGSASGGQAANSAATQQSQTAMGMQIAQLGLLQAQTEKTKAEAEKIKGVDTEKGTAETGLINIQTEIAKIQQQVQGQTIEEQATTIIANADKMLAESVIAVQKQVINEQTLNEQVAQIKAESIGAILQNIATQNQINLDKAKINEIANSIEQKWKEISIKETTSRWEHEDRLTAIKEYTKTALQTAGIHAAGNIVGDVVGIATRKVPTGKTTHTERNRGDGWSTESKYETYRMK